MTEQRITVVIHTYNAIEHIEECIKSARLLSDQIHVIDMQSSDGTSEKIKELGVNFYSIEPSLYVEPAREFGIRTAKTEWVFILDADERITSDVANEIKQTITSQPSHIPQLITYYKISRKNVFGRKKWLKHGGWWPDYQTRLIKLHAFKSWPKDIHSTPQIEGGCGHLSEPLMHYFHGDIESMVYKTVLFEGIESELLYKAKRPVSTTTFFRKFLGELNRRLIKKSGFLDGEIGIIESIYQAFSKTITYLYLYEKKKNRPL